MGADEQVQYARSKTGIRCMSETHWAEGKTKQEAYSNWKNMATRKQRIGIALTDLLSRLPWAQKQE